MLRTMEVDRFLALQYRNSQIAATRGESGFLASHWHAQLNCQTRCATDLESNVWMWRFKIYLLLLLLLVGPF